MEREGGLIPLIRTLALLISSHTVYSADCVMHGGPSGAFVAFELKIAQT